MHFLPTEKHFIPKDEKGMSCFAFRKVLRACEENFLSPPFYSSSCSSPPLPMPDIFKV